MTAGGEHVPDYCLLQTRAEAEGRECAVGALILNDAGRVLVHRRGSDRRFLPGCWDVIGGHVERGEGLLEALQREVEEETGWQVEGVPQLAHVADWESLEDGRVRARREFDFLVEVDGDLGRPRLERPKHVEFRWLGADGLGVLEQNRGADGGLVSRLVELALRSSRRGELTYPHATALIDPLVAAPIEALRSEWDPAMAAQIAAHVTLAYPVEIGSLDQLARLLRPAAAAVSPFRLRLGSVRLFGSADDGLFVEAEDVDGGWARMRHALLGSAVKSLELSPHVTLVHPRTTNRSDRAWEQLQGATFGSETVVDDVTVTAFDGRRWRSVEHFPLGAS